MSEDSKEEAQSTSQKIVTFNPFVDSSAVHRIDFPGGHWVDIKREMTTADWEKFEGEQTRLNIEDGSESLNRAQRRAARKNGEQAPARMSGSFRPSEILLLDINIVAWSFPQPLGRDSISQLKKSVTDRIVSEIDLLNTEALADSPLVQAKPESRGTTSS